MERLWRVLGLFVVIAAALASDVAAQKADPNAKKDEKLDGTLQGMQRGLLLVKAGDKDWHVMLVPRSKKKENGMIVEDPGTEVIVTGATTVDRLAPGAMVEFNADLDGKKMTAKEAVAKFKIVTFRPGSAISVVPDGAATAAAEPPKRGKVPAIPDGPALVTGLVQSTKNGKLQINVGTKKPLTVEVAEGAEVSVDAANVMLARQGDPIVVEGWYTKPGQLYAKKIEVKVSAAAAAAPTATAKKRGKAGAKPAADKPGEEKPTEEKPADETKDADAAADEGKKKDGE